LLIAPKHPAQHFAESFRIATRSFEIDGVTGRVYRSGDPAHLAEVLKELIADPDRRAMLRAAGAERALGQGPDAFVAGLERAAAVFGHG
jgi:hypothetical protein